MKRAGLVLVVLVCASQAIAMSFTEDFNSYTAGSQNWGATSHWTTLTGGTTNPFKLDHYTKDASLGPRCGTNSTKKAYLDLAANGNLAAGQSAMPAMDFSASFHFSNAANNADAFFVVLADSATTASTVPASGSLGSPINAIAWGHSATGQSNFSFFNGQTWTVVGPIYDPIDPNGGRGDFVQGTIDATGNWSVRSYNPVTGPSGAFVTGALAMSSFTFTTAAIVNVSVGSYYAGIDDIVVNAAPEPASLVLLALGGGLLLRRRTA